MAKKMDSETFGVTITGVTPLLMRRDDVQWREDMDRWLKVPENKKASKAGDDRFPAYRWLGSCYQDGAVLGIPSDNLMTLLREGAAKVASGGKNGETFKRMSQSCLVIDQIQWPLIGGKGAIKWPKLYALIEESDFSAHCEAAQAAGFELWAKPAKVGTSKHVRVRPRFNEWSASGTITSLDPRLTMETVTDILRIGGQFCGLGDWRPSSPRSPGQFGRFVAEVTRAR
jgi:hypothetical protein